MSQLRSSQQPANPNPPVQLSVRSRWLGAVLIAGIVYLVYLPSLPGGFIFDDDIYVTDAWHIHAPDGLYRIWCTREAADYYPVTNSVLWLEWRLWGMNAMGYRSINLILHIVDCLLVWLLLNRLAIPGAFLAALLFAVHPVNVETVAWISQLKELLATLFFIVSIVCYLRADDQARTPQPTIDPARFGRWYWLSLFAFVLAMLSKGSAAILPVILLFMIWRRRGRIDRNDLLRCAPFFLAALVLTPIIIWFITHGSGAIRSATFTDRILGAGSTIWFYLSKALLPMNLVFIYPQWHIQPANSLWWLPLVTAGIVTAFLWRRWPSSPWTRALFFAWAIFCTALLPVMGFTDTGYMRFSLVADHYQHIAIIAVVAVTAAGWSIWRQRSAGMMRSITFVSAVGVVSLLSFLTWDQSALYHDTFTLYTATLQRNPTCWPVQTNLGLMLANAGHLPQAAEVLSQALRIQPDFSKAHNNLGLVLASSGRLQEAIEHFELALKSEPDFPEAHNNLGNALTDSGRLPEAIEQYRLALASKPNYIKAYNNLGTALAKSGNDEQAINCFRQAIRLNQNSLATYYSLAQSYAALHRSEDAIATAEEALKLARAHGETTIAKQFENWLKSYRADQ